ncbi:MULTISPECIES: fimbrial protein [Pseudomonas]|uniref:P pilus assembly protein, pilin FimA n=1 Tax=Pseudomonas asplenii TaxID=53407 RepID=A0A0N0E5Y8_9PSED|nr:MULTISPECIES: fimbrial protein [Pseudomonas]KPA93042.1 P pilus assembly protein, pilin FimA [Pseudomonas fuscovaginae]KPA95678.1 P pilus assembly protein, pilin FimA [Pseudomonas fuscovaginae]
MKKISVMLVLLGSALGVAGSAHAANGGTLNFTGALTNTSCEVSSGGGSADNIPVDLGRVSFADIGNRTESRLGTAKDIDLLVTCLQPAAESTVHMSFRPAQVDQGDPYLLPTSGAARGVGIGLVRRDNDNFLNIQDPTDTIDGILQPSGSGSSGTLSLRALFVKNGVSTVPGAATGTVPFVLTYN